ncbi:sensor histidine kinase/response regulator [Phenylobacterium zucineum HLK1]|uniref:Sensory/regulatory protein RpfC n=1 Tax=Phenylobacterium zucineum (strain HLK1) TaxID=450851 RepID=B4RAQ1_PHEZH|nr:ATP-binding protein [Phenylobacterium zucineum]ACG79649.1 sensor histidine kinase/response regulator [Phenylobacterium zucineum HLK1]
MSVSDPPKTRGAIRQVLSQRGRRMGAALRRALAARAGLNDNLEDVLNGILNISSEGIVVLDARLRILVFSPGAEAAFGWSADEMVGQSIERLIPPALRASHRKHVEAFAAGEAQSRRMSDRSDIFGLRRNGEVFPLEVGLSKLMTSKGQIYTALLRDVSDRREAEQALALAAAEAQAANQAKSAFLAAMSHEIRTPLNGVLGMAQAMAMEDLPPHQRERLEVIRQSGESLLAILNDLLDLSKIEAGKLELEDAEFDIQELARGAHATFVAVAEARGLAFEVAVAPAARGVYRGDPLRVRQILHNLISNALKFTEAGSVRVTVGRSGGALSLVVQDTGIGIPPEKAARLFQKFEQADASTTRRFGGTGLGLAICRDLAQMMGGSIGVESAPGEGATFTVLLPLKRIARAPAPPTAAPPPPTPRETALKVLVAEDNAVNQVVLKTLLEQLGVAATVAPDGRAAVAAWEREPWDVILMDVQMPEMDGPTATGVIRRREAAEGRPRTPIVGLTANAMQHQIAEYRNAGMDDVVAKPVQVDRLVEALNAAAAQPGVSGA